MSKIRIITDSASDISTAEEQKYNILILPFPVTVGAKDGADHSIPVRRAV